LRWVITPSPSAQCISSLPPADPCPTTGGAIRRKCAPASATLQSVLQYPRREFRACVAVLLLVHALGESAIVRAQNQCNVIVAHGPRATAPATGPHWLSGWSNQIRTAGNPARHQSRMRFLVNQMESGGDNWRLISKSHPCSHKSSLACCSAPFWVECSTLMVSPPIVQTMVNRSVMCHSKFIVKVSTLDSHITDL